MAGWSRPARTGSPTSSGGPRLRTDHLFRIASHSKTFTATAVLRLVEQRRLRLEDRLADLVPELVDDAIGEASVRELLEHTSGALRDGPDGDFWQGHRDFPDRDELLAMVRVPPKTEPGERFAYSNLGYGLLGLVIESVTGTSYVDAMSELIIDPLGLTATSACYRPDRVDDYAAGHSGLHTASRRSLIASVDTRALDAATGFSSTAEDLVTYFGAHAFGDSRLLSDRSKRLMQRRANLTHQRKPEGSWYGLGMAGQSFDEHRMTGHGGGYPGHSSRTLLDPESGLVVSVMTNAIDGPAASLAAGILTLLDDAREHPTDSSRGRARASRCGALAQPLGGHRPGRGGRPGPVPPAAELGSAGGGGRPRTDGGRLPDRRRRRVRVAGRADRGGSGRHAALRQHVLRAVRRPARARRRRARLSPSSSCVI